MAESGTPRLPVHPLIKRLTSRVERRPEGAVRFAGYVGESERVGWIKLYLTLYDLSQYVEIEDRDIVRTEDAPEYLLPHKGLIIWVHERSPVRAVRDDVREARVIARILARNQGRVRPSLSGPSAPATATYYGKRSPCNQ
jgi:hypothetical protein